MFKTKFSFRKKRSDQRDNGVRETPAPPPTSLILSEQDPALASSSRFSQPTRIDQQLTSPQTVDRPRDHPVEGSARGGDPLGLKIVHKPENDRIVDIVFVHGLGGSSRTTWAKNHDLNFFWPREFLPLEPDIKNTRIFTFGYNSSFGPGRSKNRMSILDFAKDLLYDLRYAKDESSPELEDLKIGEKPIVFIVHSMGGLIVKEAYLQGEHDPAYEKIIKAVSAILFLSTPHRGTNLAETLNRILQVSFVASPMQFITELASGSNTLQRLNEQFRHVAPRLQIVSFYENRPTAMFKMAQIMVLEKDSSILGYPGEVSKPLDADHHGVCKYDSRDDPRYIAVRNGLISLIRKVGSNDDQRQTATARPARNYDELFGITESPERDYNFFHDRWTSGTCSWILDNADFADWLGDYDRHPRLLWVHGNAATGKSVLSSFVIDQLAQRGAACQYFFVRYEDEEKRNLSTILRSLASQLAKLIPEYADKIYQLQASVAADLKSKEHWNILQWLYKQGLFRLDVKYPLYWILDGVDEADNPQSLIKFFSELSRVDIPIRILATSRPSHEISSEIQKLGKNMQTNTIDIEFNQNDMNIYVEQELALPEENPNRNEIVREILKRANGNFLWVSLAVRKINKCPIGLNISNALEDLPPGMGDLYDRMAQSVETSQDHEHPTLGERILGWTTYAQRPLSVEELGDALNDDGLLGIHRTIGDLCGGFVVVDQEGKVALIHETAREYLVQKRESNGLALDKKSLSDTLYKRCISCFLDATLRAKIMRNQPPALLNYATSAWFSHLSHGSSTRIDNLDLLLRFLRGSHVLIWIHVAAEGGQLRSLVTASQYLTDVAGKLRRQNEGSLAHHQAISLLTNWATDLVKLVGKFGTSLQDKPASIYKLIPPFCPEDSALYQQFGKKESKMLHVSGFSRSTWDDCLARLPLDHGAVASAVQRAGGRIVILAHKQKTGCIFVYNSTTFQEERRLSHPERVLRIQIDQAGKFLTSYGYKTTKLWDLSTGDCFKTVQNPAKRPRPQTILFTERQKSVLIGGEDRCVRSLDIANGDSVTWDVKAKIEEQSLYDNLINAPTCSALSPEGDFIAFGYRGHPVTVWETGSGGMLVGQCNMVPDAAGITTQEHTSGETLKLAWHPFSGEVLGLLREGLMFKFDPYDEEPNATVQTGAHHLAVSSDGSLVVTGDTVGTIKVYTTTDFSLIYQLSSQGAVLDICFSVDSRRIYDIRGSCSNVWEPNALIRLAESSEYSDRSSDSWTENESIARFSLLTEQHFPGVDSIVSVDAQSSGRLYAYGTEDGIVALCEVGKGKVKEVVRLASFMSVEHICWSKDGTHLAFVDLSGGVSIKQIQKTNNADDKWQVNDIFHFNFPSQLGTVSQLLWQPSGQTLLVMSSAGLLAVDVNSHELAESILPPGMPRSKWTCHPTKPEYILAFASTKAHVFCWKDLRQVCAYTYSHPQSSQTVTPEYTGETVGRLVTAPQSPEIILELPATASGHPEAEYLQFCANDLIPTGESQVADTEPPRLLPYKQIPAEVSSQIQQPLTLLSRQRLVFLDKQRWICTLRIQSSVPAGQLPGRGSIPHVGVEQHYFLPGDWATANEARLCSMNTEGTFFCPRNEDVATVEFIRLKK